MPTAKLVLDRVDGYPGLARVYQLDPPLLYDDVEREHALVWVQESAPHMDAQVVVLPSTRSGAILGGSMRARPGTFTAHGNPFSRPEYLEGCFAYALQTAGQAELPGGGGYTIVTEDAP